MIPQKYRMTALALLTLFVWLLPQTVSAAAHGALVPLPDRPSDPGRHKRPVLTDPLIFPGVIGSGAVIPDQVHPAYPQDGAIFPPSAAVTLSWILPDRKTLPETARMVPKFFQVTMTSNTKPVVHIVKTFPFNGEKPVYNGLFFPPVSGKYGWQATVFFENGAMSKSPARYFIVKQPYYYNHYFTQVPDEYPHYTYDHADYR